MSAPRSRTTAGPASDRSGAARSTLLLVLVALVVRVAAFVRLPELTYDGTYYLRQAARLVRGAYDLSGFPPGYPAAIALLRPLCGDAVLAARLASLVAGIATIVLGVRLARRYLPEPGALAVGVFLALHPALVRVQVETLSESLYLGLLLGGLVAWENRRDLASGALLGAAFLVRPEALVVHAGLLVLRAARTRRPPLSLAAGLLPVVAYAALASVAVGHPVLSPKQGQLELWHGLAARGATLAACLLRTFPVVLLPFAVLWAWRRAPELLLPAAPLALVPLFDVHVQDRLATPALPTLAVAAAAGLLFLAPRARLLVATAASVLFAVGARSSFLGLWNSPPLVSQAREIGTALRPHLRFEDRVAGRFPHVPYYAGAGFVRAPREASYDALVDSVQAAGATHVLVLESEVDHVLPQLGPLFRDAGFATQEGRMEPAARVDAPPGARAILYALHPPPVVDAAAARRGDGVESATWAAGGWVTAKATGEIVAVDAAAGIALRGRAPAADDSGRRVAFLVGEAAAPRVAWLDVAARRVAVLESTALDLPASPVWVQDAILYVRRADPTGLRAVLLPEGRPQPVRLAGLRDEDAIALQVAARGRDVAITYATRGRERDAERVLAVAEWPVSPPPGEIELAGRWATQVVLADPAVAWVAGADLVLASLRLATADGILAAERSSLCLVGPGGLVRRLTYGLETPRRPALAGRELAFVTGSGTLRTLSLPPDALRIPPAQVFQPALPGGPTGR